MNYKPFFSIITVCYNDAWSLQKTARSVFEQHFDDFEYIVVDGGSRDSTQRLITFWREQGLVTRAISEPDRGVYDAMNKGLRMATGRFVCFMNASDVFAASNVLQQVCGLLQSRSLDGVLGWGKLNGQIWASWSEHEAFKLASLGFCHQSLYVRRDLLLDTRFDDRSFKTDSDTLQLGRLYGKGARIGILPEILSVRGGEPGISADLERSAISIRDTLSNEYPALTEEDTETILNFRRRCADPTALLSLMEGAPVEWRSHLSRMVLDTMFQRQSRSLEPEMVECLVGRALEFILSEESGSEEVKRLIFAQNRRAELLEADRVGRDDLQRRIAEFEIDEKRRIEKCQRGRLATFRAQPKPPDDTHPAPIISLTSFPARLETVSFAINSLFEQTCTPKEVHLWLGRDEVPSKDWLPKRLRMLEEKGLIIHFADRTFHQYDKFLHNSELNASAPLVIVDDDVIYPPYALEYLLDGYKRYPHAVVGNRCHRMILRPDGTPSPYSEWRREVSLPEPSFWLMPTGAGGVLYPPSFLTDERVTNIDDILACAPYADDIWLKVCALSRAVPTFATALSRKSDWYHRYTPTMQAGTLMTTNVERGLNDFQIARSFKWLEGIWPQWRQYTLEQDTVPRDLAL